MSNCTVYVGLDYHQLSIQVCIMDKSGNILRSFRCGNDVEALLRRIPFSSVHAAIESCGGAADLADELIVRAGWTVDLAHPGYVSRMKQTPDKSDFTDARLLADLVRVGYLPRVWLAPHEVRELRCVVRYRQQLVDERKSIKLRVGALLRDQRIRNREFSRWTKAWLAWLRITDEVSQAGRWVIDQHLRRLDELGQEIAQVAQRLAAMTQDDPMVATLQGFSGIGPVTSWVMRAEVGRFDRFRSGKQLARFCGLSPRNASSGERQADAGLIKAASPMLRMILIEAGHRLRRHDQRWRALSGKLAQAGKPGSLIAAAVANRWIRSLYHQMKQVA